MTLACYWLTQALLREHRPFLLPGQVSTPGQLLTHAELQPNLTRWMLSDACGRMESCSPTAPVSLLTENVVPKIKIWDFTAKPEFVFVSDSIKQS